MNINELRDPSDPRLPLISTHFNDGSLLINEKNYLAAAILEGPIEHRVCNDRYVIARRLCKAAAVVFSGTAKVPYIPIALLLPGGPLFAVGNTISFFILEYWAVSGTINDLFGPKREHEIILLSHSGIGKGYQATALTAALALALFSQLAPAFPALDYDKFPVIGFTVVLVAGAFLPLRSLQLSIAKTIKLRQFSRGEVRQKMQQIRNDTLSIIRQYKHLFIQMGFKEKIDLIAVLALTRESGTAETKVSSYVGRILEQPVNINQIQCKSLSDRIGTLNGSLVTLSFQAGLAMYSFEKTKEYLIDNNYVAAASAGAIVVSSFYIMGRSIVDTTCSIMHSFINFLTCRREKTIAEQIYPKTTLALKLIGLLVNLAALGPTLVIWGDFFSSNLIEHIYFESTFSLAIFLLLFTATLDIADSIVEDMILRNGEPECQQIVQLSQEFKSLEHLIENSSLIDFATFLSNCPDDVKGTLRTRVRITSVQLEEYTRSLVMVPSSIQV